MYINVSTRKPHFYFKTNFIFANHFLYFIHIFRKVGEGFRRKFVLGESEFIKPKIVPFGARISL